MKQTLLFLLLPAFSMMGFVSAIEPLRVANRYRADSYRWQVLSVDGGPVLASNGMSINADAAMGDEVGDEASLIFVVAGFDPLACYSLALASWLRRAAQKGAVLGALDTGAFVLARARLIGKQRVTLHWEAHPAFAEAFPEVQLTKELFEIGPRCITSAGGTASIDMMLALITQAHGNTLATQVSEQFVMGRIRTATDRQRMEISARYNLHHPRVVQAIHAMENHLEDPLTSRDLASVVGVTVRQLERLFRAHLQHTPAGFYLDLRLRHAQTLLRETDMGVAQVGLACGFGSAAHFSRSYRKGFGTAPRADRSLRTASR